MKPDIDEIISSIEKHDHVLVMDRSVEDTGIVDQLCARLKELGRTAVVACPEGTAPLAKSVTSLMQRRQEVVVMQLESSRDLPRSLARGRKVVAYYRTQQKKLPFSRRIFDVVHKLEDEDGHNHTVRLCKALLQAPDVFRRVRDIEHHDLNLAVLVLYENLISTRIPQAALHELLGRLASADEMQAEEGLYVQCVELILTMRRYPPSELRFTQHLCMYSIASTHRRRQIEAAMAR